MEQYVITISRQFGSMGRSIARELSEILGIEFLDRDIVEATAKRMGLPVSVISDEEESICLLYTSCCGKKHDVLRQYLGNKGEHLWRKIRNWKPPPKNRLL